MADFKHVTLLCLVSLVLFCTMETCLANVDDKMVPGTMFIHQNSNGSKTQERGLENYSFAPGMVSVDCLRCLCLKMSNCEPVGCKILGISLHCGYFRLSRAQWEDCKTLPGIHFDWKECSNNLECASQCIQNYMEMYLEEYRCELTCEGVSRDYYAGPNGCNNPRTIDFWYAVQEVPGCKGVK
ncbi:invertebrate-type lysozyme-like [Ruditapes philippinarum]|uniref:invertebrate-type lysozyme-like n=1 Tax=Ruditapes philippinarum TaxID=129788 RepID=UPI00295B6D8C|nr:invertebrate-type lysozyme-like [Ruditapes philippinarum]